MQIIKRVTKWTNDEIDFIRDNYLKLSDEEIGEKIGRSSSAVRNERYKLDLYRPDKRYNKKRKSTKLTFDEIKEIFNSRDCELISSPDEYIGQSYKLRYICNKHRDKGIQLITPSHLKQGKGCYYCGRERTNEAHKSKVTEDEDRKLCEIKGFEYIKTSVEDGITYIYFICNKHRILGVQKMRRGNMNRECVQGCQYCACKNLPHWYIKYMIETKYNIEVLSEYQGMNKDLTCRCKVHGDIFTTLAKNVFYNGSGCKKCSSESRGEKNRLSIDEVERKIFEKNKDVEILNLEEYTDYETVMRLKCKKCGAIFEVPFHSFVTNTGRCPVCQVGSYGEQKIAEYLINNNIMFIPQYRFDDCRGDKKPMPFDFGLLDNDEKIVGVIEYNGEQHYKPVDYFGGEEKFKDQIIRDKKKKEYCENNNIPLLIIPYWDFDTISDLLDNFISKIY